MTTYPTPERCHELLTLDRSTGKVYWKKRPGNPAFNSRFAGAEALCSLNRKGYLTGALDGRTVLAHRVIFAMENGYYPEQVDHVNRVRNDNRPENLREATAQENARNKKMKRGACGRGVSRTRGGKYLVQIYVGTFDTLEEAKAEYRRAAKMYFGEFANLED